MRATIRAEGSLRVTIRAIIRDNMRATIKS